MNSPTKVLLVEDDEDDLFLTRRTLAKAGISQVFHVGDGRDAISYLSGSGTYADRAQYPFPDCVLLDLKMPDVTGYEVLEWIKTQPALHPLRVFVLTSSVELRDRETVSRLGAAGYLVKPLSTTHIASMSNGVSHPA